MNEAVENSVDYVNNLPSEPLPSLTWRDAIAPLLALILAVLFWDVFAGRDMGYFGPGAGVPAFVGCYFGSVCLLLGKRARYTWAPVFLMAVSMALAVSCWLYSLLWLSVLNCFIILFTAAGATFLLSGQSRFSLRDARILPETVRLSVLALFTKISHPFRLLNRFGKNKEGSLRRGLMAVFATVGLLAVVLFLLSSADAVFESIFDRLGDRLRELTPGTSLWKLFRILILALFISSGLYFLQTDASTSGTMAAPAKERHALPWLLPTILLDGVYLLFCAIQIKYLFGGANAAAMAGGWAHYARKGFFQLVAVAVINLGVCLLSCHEDRPTGKGGSALRIANGLMLLLTLVILISAARRMQLYILAYGLSLLRLMTLWGMLVILAGLLAAGRKLLRPRFSFFRVFAPFVLTAWCLFCLANPGGIIADYNVAHYLSGDLKAVDTYYLGRLGPDALPALYRLNTHAGKGEDAIFTIANHADYTPRWTQHKLSYRFLPEDFPWSTLSSPSPRNMRDAP